MLRAIQNSSTMRLMLVAQTRIHYSGVQEDILNICVNTGCASTWKVCRALQSGLTVSDRQEICEWKQNNVNAAFVIPSLNRVFSESGIKYNSKICACTESPFGTTHKSTSQGKIIVTNFARTHLKTFYIVILIPKNHFSHDLSNEACT